MRPLTAIEMLIDRACGLGLVFDPKVAEKSERTILLRCTRCGQQRIVEWFSELDDLDDGDIVNGVYELDDCPECAE